MYSLYIPYIFPTYVPYMFPYVFLNLWSQRVGPDMTEVRVLVHFRMFRVQNLLFEETL